MSILKTTDTVQLVVEGRTLTLKELYSLLNEVKRRAMSLDSTIEIEMATPGNMAQVSTITVTDTVGMDANAYGGYLVR